MSPATRFEASLAKTTKRPSADTEGTELVPSEHGLLTTVGYQLGDDDPVYALEGSIAVTGSLIQWLRDNLQIIGSAPEVEALARSVDDNGDVYFVPAFSGLFAPHWRSDARGAVVGLTRFANRGHLARAALEATAYQTREVLDAMHNDSGVELTSLKVDGGMIENQLLMQFQADILGVSKRSLQRMLRRLLDAGLLEARTRRGRQLRVTARWQSAKSGRQP